MDKTMKNVTTNLSFEDFLKTLETTTIIKDGKIQVVDKLVPETPYVLTFLGAEYSTDEYGAFVTLSFSSINCDAEIEIKARISNEKQAKWSFKNGTLGRFSGAVLKTVPDDFINTPENLVKELNKRKCVAVGYAYKWDTYSAAAQAKAAGKAVKDFKDILYRTHMFLPIAQPTKAKATPKKTK